MIKHIDTVAELTKDQIDAINEFLENHGRTAFTPAQINFLTNIDELDVLQMADCCKFVRGYFIGRETLQADGLVDVDENGATLDEYVNHATEDLDKSQYSEEDYKQLIEEIKKNKIEEIAQYALILTSTNSDGTNVLYLNEDFKPLRNDGYRA